MLDNSAHVLQALCPTTSEIIITFSDHDAFVTAEKWPLANLVLIGQGYPGCGPQGGGNGSRFYAL